MNIAKLYIFLTLITLTIPIESKISMLKIPQLFSRNKNEQVTQQEFQNINSLELFCDLGNIAIHTWKQSSTLIEIKKQGTPSQLAQTSIIIKQYDNLLQVQHCEQF